MFVNSEDPRRRNVPIPRLSELPPWAFVVSALIVVVAALVLFLLNPEKFPLLGTGAALAVYLGCAWSLMSILARMGDAWESVVLNEITMMFALVLIGFVSGGLVFAFLLGGF